MMQLDNNLHNKFIDNFITHQSLVSVYITNGIKLKGVITGHDNEAIFLKGNNAQQMIYKARISAITPEIDFSG